MASLKIFSTQKLSRTPSILWASQRRCAQVHDVRFLATHNTTPERILARYREKLDGKAKEEGLSDINELKAAYKNKIESLRNEAIVPGVATLLNQSNNPYAQPQVQETTSSSSPPPPALQPTPSGTTTIDPVNKPPPGVKTLSSYLDIDKTSSLPAKEIEYLWRLRHASDTRSLCAVVPETSWRTIAQTAWKHPQFVLPLPRPDPETGENGVEMHFLQWTFPTPTTPTVLFTHLVDYKLRNEFATPHTTVTFHLDLVKSKGMVLVLGSVAQNRGVSVDEGRFLLMCLQKFYGMGAEVESRRKLLEMFSQGDARFKIDALLEEVEKID